LGRKTSETTSSGTRYYVYNAVGELVQTTDRDGRVTTYAYDALGRETAENWLNGSGVIIATTSYAYDALGRLVSTSDASATYVYTYDTLGRVASETETFADLTPTVVLTYTYDAVGDVTQTSCTIGGTADYVIEYTYNALGLVTSMRQHGVTGGDAVAEKRIDFTYDALGQYATIVYYSDIDGGTANLVMTATYTYNDVGELTSLVYTDASSATLRSFAWTYNAIGEITSENSDISSEDVTAYTYDATGQLLSVDYADQSSDDESYTYDENGNRITSDTDTYTTGDDNQTTSDGTYSYVYDGEGNLIAKYIDEDADDVLDSGDTDITEYSWDYRNRLTEAAHRDLFGGSTDWTVEYDYDAFDHRIASRYDNDGDGVADKVEHYVWEGSRVVLDFVDSDGDDNSLNDGASSASLALATRYLWGQAVDQLLAQETADDGGKEDVSYIVRDNLGSTRSLVNSSGAITATYSYDAYGNVTVMVGALSSTRFLYTCQEYDATTGLYYYNARWYSPTLGKFISQDPISFAAGDANLYRYAGNSVTIAIDPTGLADESVVYDPFDPFNPNHPSWLDLPSTPEYPGVPDFIKKYFPTQIVPPADGPQPLWIPYNPNDGGRDPTPSVPVGKFRCHLNKYFPSSPFDVDLNLGGYYHPEGYENLKEISSPKSMGAGFMLEIKRKKVSH
jgi:RHS repeat-associated protein